MPVALAGKYPKASTVVRASNSQSNQEAGSSASSAHASASYHGSTYGQANSQARTSAKATVPPTPMGRPRIRSPLMMSTASTTINAMAPTFTMSVAAVPAPAK